MQSEWKSFYQGKKVLVTGHTGFKGSWLVLLLQHLGAEVSGYALEPPTSPSLFNLCELGNKMKSHIGDIRDLDRLKQVFDEEQPEIVFHLAAQPLVRESYRQPVITYDTNVMGTVNLLECVRLSEEIRSVAIITTDKVYQNVGKKEGYIESDRLDGWDPYSNSKSCADLVTGCYMNSFLREKGIPVSVFRAGNVIGGGDFAAERLVPDCVRAVISGDELVLRNPAAVRPFQHVLEPVTAYIRIAYEQMVNRQLAGCYNIGPDATDCLSVSEIADFFAASWEEVRTAKEAGHTLHYRTEIPEFAPKEASYLSLSNELVKRVFGIRPVWDGKQAVKKTVEWTRSFICGEDISTIMVDQIEEFLAECDSEQAESSRF